MATPIVLDSNSLIVRCIMASALDDLQAGGTWTGGVYGTLNTLVSVLGLPGITPGAIYACFDAGIPPARMAALPDYKAARAERRHLLSEEDRAKAFEQMDLAREMFGLLGLVCLKYREREADDTVAAVVRLLRRQGETPLVVTGDRDLWQTVGMGAQVWDLNKKRVIDTENFADVAGVPVSRYLLYKALCGDPSDGILGADGVGPVRAVQVLTEHADVVDAAPTPADQLDALVDALQAQAKRRKFEASIVEALMHLHCVLVAINLDHSFGGTAALATALRRDPPCDQMPFLRFCKRLQFASVLGNPDRYFTPFRRAWARRPRLALPRVAR